MFGYDYSQEGMYFVTICAHGRECVFGEVVDDHMGLNDCGQIARQEWQNSAEIRNEIKLDAFVVMPNHIHGIVIINGDAFVGGIRCWIQIGGDQAHQQSTRDARYSIVATQLLRTHYS